MNGYSRRVHAVRMFVDANQDRLVDDTSDDDDISNKARNLEQKPAASLWAALAEHFAAGALVKTIHLNNMNTVFGCVSLLF